MVDTVTRYVVEVRVRVAGEVHEPLPVLAVLELPTGTLRLGHRSVGGALDWCLQHLQVWMRSKL
jgi:hypothetical protein